MTRKYINSFRDLEVYQNSYNASIIVAKRILPKLPPNEKFDLTDQLSRSTKAVPRLIAEGYAKRHQVRGFQKYLDDAMTEANETIVGLEQVKDIYQIEVELCDQLIDIYDKTARQLHKLAQAWDSFRLRRRQTTHETVTGSDTETETGFTLVELLVVVAVSVLLILAGTTVFIANGRFYENQKGGIAAVNATRAAGDRANEFARAATAVVLSRAFSGATYTSGGTAVVLRVPAIDSSGNIIASTYDFVAFGRDPGNAARLLLLVDADSASFRKDRTLQVTDKLTSIAITYDQADPAAAKQITYTITVTGTGRYPVSEQITGAVTLRN